MVRAGRIAATGDTAAAERMAAEKTLRYATHPKELERDVRRFSTEFDKLIESFKKAVIGEWGNKEAKKPSPKEYVKYTQNYLARASVDFDQGIITVETVEQRQPLQSLKNAIVTTLLTPDDPRAVDLFSANTVKLGEIPFLYGEVRDHDNKYVRWSWRAERFADHLIKSRLQTRRIKTGEQTKPVRYVVIAMVKDHHQIRAQKYSPLVQHFSMHFSVSKNLVYAVTKVESDFNPYAVSSAPAFGLMQIVPTTAGRDVYRFLHQKDGLPSRGDLFIPENNIQYGVAYLHLLSYEYLNRIQNPVSREYCVIAAYNGGAGTILDVFHSDRNKAPDQINKLSPLEVFNTLRTRLPRDETRRYLAKVMEAKKEFVSF
jgi:membrane-bound lytic murein transglycosylase C